MPRQAHTMPESDAEVQKQVQAVFGYHPCLWQIHVLHAVLDGKDVITIAPTGSGKSSTYWMPLLYIKYRITVVITPLKLLGAQCCRTTWSVSITAAKATNELFEVILFKLIVYGMSDIYKNHRR
jgi:superfamily II DNA helicase RecQ